uniref:Cytochrome c oxidase assembly protein COX11, mitochondrial n=1 Tax=Macrostomum lignano TaxID=282301 RepID=A0A1I8GZT0_9PLAT
VSRILGWKHSPVTVSCHSWLALSLACFANSAADSAAVACRCSHSRRRHSSRPRSPSRGASRKYPGWLWCLAGMLSRLMCDRCRLQLLLAGRQHQQFFRRFKSDTSARFGQNPGPGGPWQSRGKPAVDAGATATMYMSAAAVFMLGLSYASVPLYRKFCQITGTASNPLLARVDNIERVREMRPVADCPLVVNFIADTHSQLAWNFRPQQPRVQLVPGETVLVFYTARNPTDVPVTGIATYTVNPYQASQYFNKIQCFCFEEQRLNPGEEVDMPVFFYIDPEFINDPRLRDVRQITLSYCFFEAKEGLSLSSRSAKPDYQELMEQQLDDLRFHESRAELHRSVLSKFLGDSLAETVLSPDTLPELHSLVRLAVEQGFDTLDVAHLLEQKLAKSSKQASKAASAQRQIEKDSLEAKKFQAAAETLEANLQSLGFADNLTHESLIEAHLSNQHLAAEKQSLLAGMARFNGLSPDLTEARAEVEELEREVARLQAEIHEQGRFLLQRRLHPLVGQVLLQQAGVPRLIGSDVVIFVVVLCVRQCRSIRLPARPFLAILLPPTPPPPEPPPLIVGSSLAVSVLWPLPLSRLSASSALLQAAAPMPAVCRHENQDTHLKRRSSRANLPSARLRLRLMRQQRGAERSQRQLHFVFRPVVAADDVAADTQVAVPAAPVADSTSRGEEEPGSSRLATRSCPAARPAAPAAPPAVRHRRKTMAAMRKMDTITVTTTIARMIARLPSAVRGELPKNPPPPSSGARSTILMICPAAPRRLAAVGGDNPEPDKLSEIPGRVDLAGQGDAEQSGRRLVALQAVHHGAVGPVVRVLGAQAGHRASDRLLDGHVHLLSVRAGKHPLRTVVVDVQDGHSHVGRLATSGLVVTRQFGVLLHGECVVTRRELRRAVVDVLDVHHDGASRCPTPSLNVGQVAEVSGKHGQVELLLQLAVKAAPGPDCRGSAVDVEVPTGSRVQRIAQLGVVPGVGVPGLHLGQEEGRQRVFVFRQQHKERILQKLWRVVVLVANVDPHHDAVYAVRRAVVVAGDPHCEAGRLFAIECPVADHQEVALGGFVQRQDAELRRRLHATDSDSSLSSASKTSSEATVVPKAAFSASSKLPLLPPPPPPPKLTRVIFGGLSFSLTTSMRTLASAECLPSSNVRIAHTEPVRSSTRNISATLWLADTPRRKRSRSMSESSASVAFSRSSSRLSGEFSATLTSLGNRPNRGGLSLMSETLMLTAAGEGRRMAAVDSHKLRLVPRGDFPVEVGADLQPEAAGLPPSRVGQQVAELELVQAADQLVPLRGILGRLVGVHGNRQLESRANWRVLRHLQTEPRRVPTRRVVVQIDNSQVESDNFANLAGLGFVEHDDAEAELAVEIAQVLPVEGAELAGGELVRSVQLLADELLDVRHLGARGLLLNERVMKLGRLLLSRADAGR